VQIPWTGEDIKHVDNGIGYETVYGDQIAQAFRTCANKMELDLWAEVRANATRAYGTAGTTPFASSFNELPQVRKILVDNGMPFDGNVSLVMDTFAGANLRSLAQLQKINESNDPSLLRQGAISELMGFLLKDRLRSASSPRAPAPATPRTPLVTLSAPRQSRSSLAAARSTLATS
jgi:hypothetical protein